jgi:hypothetical protein
MKTENNHTNHTVESGAIQMKAPGQPTTLWTKVKNIANASLPAIAGIMWGVGIVSIVVLFSLISIISSRQDKCDAIGEQVEVRSEYRKSSGCNLLINGNWTPVSELKFTATKKAPL